MSSDSRTGRRKTIEVTEEMIRAAGRELLLFDPEFMTTSEGAVRLLRATFSASRDLCADFRTQDCVHAEQASER